ncbi:ABC transporter ATP-binding protein [Dyella flagellata]|uniref:ABC transporter ATP-binding protein n=1 Tax=Dyella flagellata TaxID=1867833 RepID=A0ABQ5X8E5_9GAMM|nr:ABC transporter ATP-binding protein [Dyella flagellata]GLQ87925.1 ABC transporter ATP-binding protein [Dyella flagellata]
MSVAVQLERVAKFYRRGAEKVEILQGIDLDIGAGQFLALMGPSGSGKTTLLNLIGGLDRPSAGCVTVAGERVNELSDLQLTRWRKQHVGFIFQMYNLMPKLTVDANVELPLMLTGLGRKQRASHVAAALAMVGLSDRAKHRPAELSGGQQQRVAIARAIIADPALLVCDEPTGDLDRQTGTGILELLRTLNRELGKTIIMVTHDPVAANFAARRLYVDKGQLLEAAA